MRGKDITEFNDRNDKLVRLRIKKCQASNKRTYFRLTGRRKYVLLFEAWHFL